KANLRKANLAHSTFISVDLTGAFLTGANLFNATLNYVVFTGSYLLGADFSETKPNSRTLVFIYKELHRLGTTCRFVEQIRYYSSLIDYFHKHIPADGSPT